MTSANFKINVQEYINEIVVEEGRNSPWNGVLKLLPGCKEIKKITITMDSDIEWLYVWHIYSHDRGFVVEGYPFTYWKTSKELYDQEIPFGYLLDFKKYNEIEQHILTWIDEDIKDWKAKIC